MNLLILLPLACAGASDPVVADPLASVPPPAEPAGPALHGDRVDVALPDFAGVVASDGSPRRRDALLGRPTALWFYPAAGTPG